MKIARLGDRDSEIPVIQSDGRSFDLRSISARIDGAFFASDGITRSAAAYTAGDLPELVGADSMRIGAPINAPGKIVCIGLNYRDHASETGAAEPAEPVVFMKDPSTIVGPFDRVFIPRASLKTDWEVEVGDPQALAMRTSVNGVVRQNGSSSNMIFGVRHLLWYLSQFMVLRPGDLINTGTPAGVALGLPDHPYLRAGDTVELEIEGLGIARQHMVQA
jgi:2-keto-4-pentenoate hydratase/2-oxohepta-3-ene-1,7-dioic acid hydratase in catechol pathway